MWTQVTAADTAGLARHVAIMQKMNRGYGLLTPRDLLRSINEQRGEIWHYQGQGFEVGLLFQYFWEKFQWQLAQVGFVGEVEPAVVLELNVELGRRLYQAHNIDVAFCVVPHQMDYRPILDYYRLCERHPALEISVVHQSENRDYWEIRYATAVE